MARATSCLPWNPPRRFRSKPQKPPSFGPTSGRKLADAEASTAPLRALRPNQPPARASCDRELADCGTLHLSSPVPDAMKTMDFSGARERLTRREELAGAPTRPAERAT